MKAFHAYDIRGVYNEDFNLDDVYKTGYFIPKLLKTDKVLVGRDARESSPAIFDALSKGINDAGADVYNAGMTTTPMIYYFTAKHQFEGSIMITASHNPRQYNGLKISGKNATPIGYHSGLKELEELVKNDETIVFEQKGKIIDYPVKKEYLEFQKGYLSDISNLNVTIDCSNGMAGLLINDLLGDSVNYINNEIDGTFPSHDPNPLNPDNLVQLRKAVLMNKSDLGVIFDGDADRVMFLDEKGKFISPDLIIALLGHYFLTDGSDNKNVLQDIRSSKAVGEYLEQFGGIIHTWRVGRAFASPKLKEINGIYGGELAGHYYFRDFYYSDSGILASLIVLKIFSEFKKRGLLVSEVMHKISGYHNSGEINFLVKSRERSIKAVKDYFLKKEKPVHFFDFDGYRLDYKDWWFNIRPSNTEPYLRFLAEATTQEKLDEVTEEVKSIIESID